MEPKTIQTPIGEIPAYGSPPTLAELRKERGPRKKPRRVATPEEYQKYMERLARHREIWDVIIADMRKRGLYDRE